MEITEELSKYNQKQVKFILSLLQTGNISKSAKIAEVSEMTAHKWLKNRFKRRYKQIKKKLYSR